jgi:hypothetical protein
MRIVTVGVALVCVATAQTEPDRSAPAEQTLRAALAKTRKVALSFRSRETHDVALLRNLPIAGEPEVIVVGTVHGNTVRASLDDDEVLFAAGRMVARSGNGAWQLRRRCLVDGRPLPFIFDPHALCHVLGRLPVGALTPAQSASSQSNGKDFVTHVLHFVGTQAQEFVWSGALPGADGGRVRVVSDQTGAPAGKTEIELDLALTVDVTAGVVVRVQSRIYSKEALPTNVALRFAGAPSGQRTGADDSDAQTRAAHEAGLHVRDGLPERKVGAHTSVVTFDVTLSEHGTARPIEISAAVRALLER